MNSVNLIGRLVRDPDVRHSGENTVAMFTLAVDRPFKKDGEKSADFISCKAFGKTAELIEKYMHKGSQLGISGHINTGSYVNKEGNTVYTTEVIVDRMDFVGSKSEGSGDAADPVAREAAAHGFEALTDDVPF